MLYRGRLHLGWDLVDAATGVGAVGRSRAARCRRLDVHRVVHGIAEVAVFVADLRQVVFDVEWFLNRDGYRS